MNLTDYGNIRRALQNSAHPELADVFVRDVKVDVVDATNAADVDAVKFVDIELTTHSTVKVVGSPGPLAGPWGALVAEGRQFYGIIDLVMIAGVLPRALDRYRLTLTKIDR